jgi:hypothetical protein
MTLAVRRSLAVGISLLGIGCVIAVSPPTASAEGGIGGTGTGALTGPGGTTLGTVTTTVTGKENVPGGAPGAPGCLTGGCSASLTTVSSIATGPGGTVPPPGLYITPTVTLPQPNAVACITAQCYNGRGTLAIGGGVSTPVIGATGGFNGYIHG